MSITRTSLVAALLGAALTTACDDGTKKTLGGLTDDAGAGERDAVTGQQDAGGGGGADTGTGPTADAAPDTDVAVVEPDAAADAEPPPEPDAEVVVVDAAAPEADAGPACDPGDDSCDFPAACIEGACRPDLSPSVFRLVNGNVNRPGGMAGQRLSAFMMLAIEQGNLNLMFEAAGYQADGSYRFHVATGIGEIGGVFALRHDRAIQSADGVWRDSGGSVFWEQDEAVPFRIDLPNGSVLVPYEPPPEGYFLACDADDMAPAPQDPERIFCFNTVTTQVRVSAVPALEQGSPRLLVTARGWLRERDAEAVSISVVNGEPPVPLPELLSLSELDFDANGDGINDSWEFELTGTATPVAFDDPNCARNPLPPPRNAEVCAGR